MSPQPTLSTKMKTTLGRFEPAWSSELAIAVPLSPSGCVGTPPAANLRVLCSPLSPFTGERASHTKGEPRQPGFLAARPAPFSRSSRWRAEAANGRSARPRSSLAAATSTRPPSAASGRITGSLPTRLTSPGSASRASPAARPPPPARCGTATAPWSRPARHGLSGHSPAATCVQAPAPRRPPPGPRP
jgi:hypothetical protein